MGWRCVLFQKCLALYVGDDLSEREARAVETHLQNCPACRKRVDALAQSRRLLTDCRSNASDIEPLGSSMWPELANQLRERNVSRRHNGSWLPVGAMVAASVAIGVVFWNRPVNLPPLSGAVPGPGAATSNDWNAPDWAAGLTLPTRSDRATARTLRSDAMMDEPYFHLETAVPAALSNGDF